LHRGFVQTNKKHRLEQTHLSEALMPDEIMPSKLMREVLLISDFCKYSFFFFSPVNPSFQDVSPSA